jgi:hypothetical protein
MSINENIQVFKEHLEPALSKSTMTEQEIFNLIISGSMLFRQGVGITYSAAREIINEEYIKNKFNIGG